MKPIVSLLALSLLTTTGTVFAADPPATKPAPTDHSQMQHGEMDHSKMDHSKMDHGKPADHQEMAADEFAALDKNKDGKLSKAEVPASSSLAAHFDMLDADRNGSLDQAESAKHHGM